MNIENALRKACEWGETLERRIQMDFYEFARACEEDGLTAEEAQCEWERAIEARRAAFMDAYYDDPWVNEGLAQQDLIDLYRSER